MLKSILISFMFMSQIILGFTSLQDTTDTTKRGLMIELGGMLVDQTQSKLGREFYDIFYYRWESPEVEMPYTIFFTEKALPSFGTQISIVIN